ncbi:MAG: hypothetical protein IH626_20030 [Rhodospirillales bacterium]|nr:hypothetical protein [Rhodospirillales bacterium]
MDIVAVLSSGGNWVNKNQGILAVILFAVTAFYGWVSGIFSALRRKPKFKIALIQGPSFCCTFLTGKKSDDFAVHRTGIALYLQISNVGSAPSSIENISVGYHWSLNRISLQWLRYAVGWFWLHEQSIAINDFQANIGANIKVYPFLTQRSILSGESADTFLEVGQSTNGVVYFEQSDSWGGCFPSHRKGIARLKVSVRDVFGGRHKVTFDVPVVTIEEARKYNPSFGKTFAELRGEVLPHDVKNNDKPDLTHA